MSVLPGWDFDIVRDADWVDPLPQLINENGSPLNLTGRYLQLFIRPTYDHATLIRLLSSDDDTGIVIDDAEDGLATIDLPRAQVIADIPMGTWDWFLILRQSANADELARGVIRVHGGSIVE